MDHISVDEQAALFGVLADPTRLKLLKLLTRQQEPNALCVNALASRLGVTQSAVSQHLRILKSAGLVRGERCGYRIHYFINQEVVNQAQQRISRVLQFKEQTNNEDGQEEVDNGIK